jgi:hypothetical protein
MADGAALRCAGQREAFFRQWYCFVRQH